MPHIFIIVNKKLTTSKIINEIQKVRKIKHSQVTAGSNPSVKADFSDDLSEKNVNKKGVVYFIGYADGVMYDAFNAIQYEGIRSGTGAGLYVSSKLARERLILAARYILSNHPELTEQATLLISYADNILSKKRGEVTVIYC